MWVLSTLGPACRRPRRLTSERFGYLLGGQLWVVPEQQIDGHHYPWAAEATLRAVTLGKCLLGEKWYIINALSLLFPPWTLVKSETYMFSFPKITVGKKMSLWKKNIFISGNHMLFFLPQEKLVGRYEVTLLSRLWFLDLWNRKCSLGNK